MKGKLSIGKVTCCGKPDEDYINIEIEDSLSSIQFVRAKVNLVTFTRALFGLSSVPIEYKLLGLNKIGKKYEHKIVEVSIPNAPDGIGLTDEDINKAISKYEIDGWLGRSEDCKNHHNHVHSDEVGQVYRVLFSRWVEVEGEEDEKES